MLGYSEQKKSAKASALNSHDSAQQNWRNFREKLHDEVLQGDPRQNKCSNDFGVNGNCRFQKSVSRRGGRNKGGRKQMRANANKRRQTLTNASKCRGENASKRKQTRANADKRKQTLTPPFIVVFYTPLCNPLKKAPRTEGGDKIQGSVGPRFPAGLPSRCPKSWNVKHFAIRQVFPEFLAFVRGEQTLSFLCFF